MSYKKYFLISNLQLKKQKFKELSVFLKVKLLSVDPEFTSKLFMQLNVYLFFWFMTEYIIKH